MKSFADTEKFLNDSFVITVVEMEEEEEEEEAVALKKRVCGWKARAAGKPMMGDLMAIPMGTGPRSDDLAPVVKNCRNCCPPIPKPRMLPGWKHSMRADKWMYTVSNVLL